MGRGVPLSIEGRSWEKFSIFEPKNVFWCILGATFAVELNGKWLSY